MAFELEHVGAVVHVTMTSETEWSASAQLFAENSDGDRISATGFSVGAGGPRHGISAIWKRYSGPSLPDDPAARRVVLENYHVQRQDVEDALNQLLGRDPEQHRPPRLSWQPLIELLQQRGVSVTEEKLIEMPFVFEFSQRSLSALEG
jgi:hypothetical protein